MSNMRLVRYRVEKYKSVMDSGWIDCDDVTTLVGVNEAGKSNLLLALWKLNPAKGGEIVFSDDMPVKLFSELRNAEKKPQFIHAIFEITSEFVLEKISELSGFCPDSVRTVSISRDYDGVRFVSFPDAKAYDKLPVSETVILLQKELSVTTELDEMGKTEEGIKTEAIEKINTALKIVEGKDYISNSDATSLYDVFDDIHGKVMQTSKIRPVLIQLKEYFSEMKSGFERPNPSLIEEVREIVFSNMPKFVYYSNYGNLDSEIYLPHVIDNQKRTDLTGIAEAKARTLRVLFEYVNLDPKEILEMGRDAQGRLDGNGNQVEPPSEKEIQQRAEKKKERDVLLQSASTKLTRDFREWWNQGNYNFEFRADGKHFRIWVSDDVRPERIVLENRSTGLQWFMSFYLVFLVESEEAHAGAILLLDEAGLSLHPLAQKDLSLFFNNLAKTNQIVNTTHSPFLIDINHVERAKVVFVDKDGYTVVSNDLRAAESRLKTNSVYAVHAALGLSVSDILLQGCRPVIVEGPSDQYYFNAIKLFLICKKLIEPKQEIIFVPSGGVKAVGSLASLLSGKNDLPSVILDSDKSGRDFKDKLCRNLYAGEPYKILEIFDFNKVSDSEVEDIIPFQLLQRPIDRIFNNIELDFSEVYNPNTPIIPQIEKFADDNAISLPNGYKVELARQFKQILQNQMDKYNDDTVIYRWKTIFDSLLQQ